MENVVFIGKNKFKVIDLTKPLQLETNVFPGDPRLIRKEFCRIENCGYEHYIHEIGDHNFQPHADAPNHQNIDMKDIGIEYFDKLKYCFNKACLIDLSETDDAQTIEEIKFLREIDKKHIEPYSEQLRDSNAVLIRTGYDKWIEANKAHIPGNIPYLTKEAAEYLYSFENINVIGIDSLTIDPSGVHTAHNILTKDRLILESIANLYEIPEGNRNEFTLQSSPLIITGATGAPVIAYALIEIG